MPSPVPGAPGGPTACVTTAVAAEVAVAEPAMFEAVTVTRMVEPASAEAAAYVADVAPEIGLQFPPELAQRTQPYECVIGVEPDHVPVEAESVCPTTGVPEIDGRAVDVGGDGLGGGGGGGAGGVAFETVTVTVEEPAALPLFENAFAVS